MALSVTSPIWQQVATPALDMRRLISSLVASEGIVSAGDLLVAQRAAGANMSVDVSAGRALIQGDLITQQGMYFAYNDGTVNVTGFSAANATNPRIDRVCLRVRDAFHGDAANDVAFVIVTGTATSGATLSNLTGAAAVPASHLLLANILIPATATTITTANIDATVRPTLALVGATTELGYQVYSSDQTTTSTTYVDLFTFAAATFQGVKHYLQITIPNLRHSATNGSVSFQFMEGASPVGNPIQFDLETAGSGKTAVALVPFTPSGGPHTYKLQWKITSAGTGTIKATGAGDAVFRIFKA
jgi:hypothetical protein